MQIIRRNLGLKLLSVALAVIGWAYVRFAGNSALSSHFTQQLSIPIATVGVPVGEIPEFAEREAVVTIATKPGSPAVKPDEIKAIVDLSGKGPGVYTLPVQIVGPPVEVQSLSPASVTITVEQLITRMMPVAVHYVGTPQRGVVVLSASTVPAEVTVRGPAQRVAAIASVRVDVPVPSQPGAYDAMVRPASVDARGRAIPNLQVSPDLVRVRVRSGRTESGS